MPEFDSFFATIDNGHWAISGTADDSPMEALMDSRRLRILSVLAILASALALGVSARAEASAPAVVAKLSGKLDTKSAKVGDTIVAKTVTKTKLADGTELPRGTKLTGTVVAVQSKQSGGGTSTLSIKFDQAEVKGKGNVAVHGGVVAVAPPKDPGNLGDLPTGSTSSRNQSLATPGGLDHPDSGSDDIPLGSTIPGVGLGDHPGADGTSQLRGDHRDIKLEDGGLVKIEFF
jgi:hypothetical protein